MKLASLGDQTRSWTARVLAGCGIRARGRSDTPQIRRVPQRHGADARNASTRPSGDRHVGETEFRLM